MITKGYHAWILHKRPSGDTSAQVTFFTREKGIISALSRGGRTPKKQSLLQAFTPLWVCFDTRGDWHYINQLDVISPSLTLTGHSLFASLYVNEIIYHGLYPFDSHPMLYDAYTYTVQQLTTTTHRQDIEALLRRFEWQFLLSCGYSFSLTHEAFTQNLIMAHHDYDFIAGEGFVLTNQGFSGECLIAMANDQLNDDSVLKVAKWIMRRAIDHALNGKQIKARELYLQTLS